MKITRNFNNLCEVVFNKSSIFNNKTALNFKENGQIRSFSNQEFCEKILQFACGLKEIGLHPKQTLVNYSYQNPIWLIVDFATILAGGVSVPIFHNISAENLNFEINDCAASFLFTDNKNMLSQLNFQDLKPRIICYNLENNDSTSFDEVLKLGKISLDAKKYDLNSMLAALNQDDIATIVYTSGSTNRPKGVMISHRNLLCQIRDAAEFFPLQNDDVALSFLPLAHIFERMVMIYYLSCGISIYFADDINNLSALLREFKPTLMTVVPRALEKAHNSMLTKIDSSGFVAKLLGRIAYNHAMKHDFSSSKRSLPDLIFDFLVYRKFRNGFGGKIRMIICGGSALNPKLENFFWNIGVKVYCGYGLTESSPVLAANCPQFFKLGTVGKAFPSVKLKIADDGELLASGENIMLGYHRLDEETTKQISNGWLKTGDEAKSDDQGFIKIVGRKKEIVKNSYGKFVNLAKIEQEITKELNFLVGTIAIADGKNFTSALLFIDFDQLAKFKKTYEAEISKFESESKNSDLNNELILKKLDRGILLSIAQNSSNSSATASVTDFNQDLNPSSDQSSANLKNKPSIHDKNNFGAIFEAIPDLNNFLLVLIHQKICDINQKLDHWEQIKKLVLITEKISVETGEITPSMKLKRKTILEKFQSEISEIYSTK